MSGPKRADVEAELGRAQAAARRTASIIAEGESAALLGMLTKINREVDECTSAGSELAEVRGHLRKSRSDVLAVSAAIRTVTEAEAAIATSSKTADLAMALEREASRMEDVAKSEFAGAEAKYEHTLASLRAAGAHYLQPQMAEARQAKLLFEKAADHSMSAQEARARARITANDALKAAISARATAVGAIRHGKAAVAESLKRDRSEAQARRMAEVARRRATMAVDAAKGAVAGLDGPDCDKFRPGRKDELLGTLSFAESTLHEQAFDESERAANSVTTAVSCLATEVAAARSTFDRLQAEATAALSDLEATVDGADPSLIADWSPDRDAVESARRALVAANNAVIVERFDEAASIASVARDQVTVAIRAAAEALGAHERRVSIGEAVMDVLEEMGFDVSFEQGDRSTPLRISGQTADPNGRGDFNIDMPLGGAIDFEVTEGEGDGSCAPAVQDVQTRLAERGVTWRTTDWGHAHDPERGTGRRRDLQQERTQTRTRSH